MKNSVHFLGFWKGLLKQVVLKSSMLTTGLKPMVQLNAKKLRTYNKS